MLSFVTMAVHALGTALIYLLNAFFSLLTWFLKFMFKGLRLLFVVLPLSTVVFAVLLGMVIYASVTGDVSQFPSAASMLGDLGSWWQSQAAALQGGIGYQIFLFLSLLMFIPVVTVLFSICALTSAGHTLFIGVVLDAAIYLVRLIFGKGFVAQAMGRYYRLFPEAGRRHEIRRHDELIRQRNRELEKEIKESRNQKRSSFYEDPEDDYEYDRYDEYNENYYEDDSEYEDDYYEDGKLEDNEFEDDLIEDGEYEDPDYDEYDEQEEFDEYEDEYFDRDSEEDYGNSNNHNNRRRKSSSHSPILPSGSFNFFAGCNTKESADKKYKSLVKLYHPDNMDGDTAALQEINAQYTAIKKKLS